MVSRLPLKPFGIVCILSFLTLLSGCAKTGDRISHNRTSQAQEANAESQSGDQDDSNFNEIKKSDGSKGAASACNPIVFPAAGLTSGKEDCQPIGADSELPWYLTNLGQISVTANHITVPANSIASGGTASPGLLIAMRQEGDGTQPNFVVVGSLPLPLTGKEATLPRASYLAIAHSAGKLAIPPRGKFNMAVVPDNQNGPLTPAAPLRPFPLTFEHVLFVSSETFSPALATGGAGSLSVADGHCQRLADAGHLSGIFRAILSFQTNPNSSLEPLHARDRLMIRGTVKRPDGVLLASDQNSFWGGSLRATPSLTESSVNLVDVFPSRPLWVMTGTLPNGKISWDTGNQGGQTTYSGQPHNCADWTNADSGSSFQARVGHADLSDSGWIAAQLASCPAVATHSITSGPIRGAHLYCLSQ